MHHRLLIACALLAPTLAHASGLPPRCHTEITAPLSGATAVALDAVIRGSSSCSNVAPRFVDDLGATIPATFTPDATSLGGFTVTPLAPLAANRTYTVTFADHLPCDGPLSQTRFTTGGTPGIRALGFQSSGDALVGLDVSLTEPVLHAADLADGTTWVTATVDGYALVPPIYADPKKVDGLEFYYKPLAVWPTLAQTFHVRLHKGLPFASGVTLADDVEVTVVPKDAPYGWVVTGSRVDCALPDVSTSAFGCSAQRAGRARGLLGLVALALGLLARRRGLRA